MKLEVEKRFETADLSQNNTISIAKIRGILLGLLTSNIEKKIDWASSENNDQTSIKASIHVMNAAEWNAAKKIIKDIAEEFPGTEDKVLQALNIIDPILPSNL